MKKRILSILLSLCTVFCFVPTGVFAEGGVLTPNADITGSGTAEDPYLIYTADGLKAFRDKANGGERNAFAKLMNDIVLNDGTFDKDGKYTAADGSSAEPEKWTPIGTDNNQYRGTFDGNGKTIKGLYVNTESDKTAGLFGATGGPTIKNLTVDGSVTGKCWVGGILGFSTGGVIENCTNNASVTVANFDSEVQVYIGGIAGLSYSKLIGCGNTGKITVKNVAQIANVGGLAGYQMHAITDCYNTGDVSGEAGTLYLGGISGGIVVDVISNCYSTGKLDSTGSTTVYLGGIVGLNTILFDLTNNYYLEGTADKAAGRDDAEMVDKNTVKPMPKEAFGDGTVLNLMINGREDGTHPWSGACGYIESVGMVLPILKNQKDVYGHSHCICGGSSDVGDHTVHTDTDWTPWTSTDSLPTKAGSYYLMNNITLTYDLDRGGFWTANENIDICLNGKTISSNAYALRSGKSAALSVTDCGGSGKIIGGNIYTGSWTNIISSVICEGGSVFNLYGGAILMNEEGKGQGMGNRIVAMYRDIDLGGAEFNMYGGSIGESSHIGTEDECRYLEVNSYSRFNAYGGAIYGPAYLGLRAKVNFGNTAFATDVRHRRDYSFDFMGTEPTNFIGDARMVWEYPFFILVGDTRIRIDDRNKDDILGDGSGSLKYEFDENSQIDSSGNFDEEKGHGTLTFNNAKLVYDADSKYNVIDFDKYYSLDIVLKGKNAIVPDEGAANGDSVIIGRKELTIKGDGSLDIISKRNQCMGCGFSLDDENITILTSTNPDGTGAVKTDVGDSGALSAAKYLRIGAAHTHCICGNNAGSNHSHTDTVWTPWASSDSLPSAAGSYYLVDNVMLPMGDITMPEDVTICLNGNSIRGNNADNTKLKVNGSLCITDCETTGNLADITLLNGKLIVWGAEIKSGIFNGEVENNGRITGGIFYGRVSGSGIIEDSAKRTLTFDSNGGSKVDEIKVLRGQTAAAPADPTMLGHKFSFWLKGGAQYSFADTVLDNINLTAKWTVNSYTVTVKPENGESDIIITQDYGTAITKPADPTREGYTFAGWDKTIPTTMPAENVTVKAKWQDTEKPTGEISVGTSKWKTFLNNITFGLFFKDTQTVTVTAADNSGEAVKIEYLLSAKKLTVTELAGSAFTVYTSPFGINPDNKYIIYVKLTDKAGNTDYICSDGIVLDSTNPVIGGIENGKTYCAAQTVTITEKYVKSITVNGVTVTPIENNTFTLTAADVEQKIVVIDEAGNTAEMTATVNNGHTPNADDGDCTTPVYCKFCNAEVIAAESHDFIGDWHSNETKHWHICQNENCTVTDTKTAHSGDDDGDCTTAVLCGCGYVITAAKPAHTFGEWISGGDGTHTRKCTENGCNGSETENCSGGKATCTDKAICEVCGKPYGEPSSANHADLKHVEAKEATEKAEGNTEYWHCDGCDKYYSDAAAAKEITKADTVTEKLPDSGSKPQTGDGRNPAKWIALLFISGGVLAGAAVFIKKKKRSEK